MCCKGQHHAGKMLLTAVKESAHSNNNSYCHQNSMKCPKTFFPPKGDCGKGCIIKPAHSKHDAKAKRFLEMGKSQNPVSINTCERGPELCHHRRCLIESGPFRASFTTSTVTLSRKTRVIGRPTKGKR